MSAHRRRQIDRDTAERLLRGAVQGGQRSGKDPVVDVLAAIAVPTHTVSAKHVLAGEEQAVTAFREARVGHALAAPKKSIAKVAVASLLTWKALAAAGITASAIGGAAIVGGAEPGSAPPPASDAPTASRSPSNTSANAHMKTRAAETPSPAAGAPDSVPGTPLPSGNTAGAPVPTSQADSPAVAASRAATSATSPSAPSPSPSLEGLCRAYRAQGGGVLQNPAFDTLVEAAGEGKVADYCAGVLGPETSDREPNKATSTPTSQSSTTSESPPESGTQSFTQPADAPAPTRGNATGQSAP
jgi:hypothetical protein